MVGEDIRSTAMRNYNNMIALKVKLKEKRDSSSEEDGRFGAFYKRKSQVEKVVEETTSRKEASKSRSPVRDNRLEVEDLKGKSSKKQLLTSYIT